MYMELRKTDGSVVLVDSDFVQKVESNGNGSTIYSTTKVYGRVPGKVVEDTDILHVIDSTSYVNLLLKCAKTGRVHYTDSQEGEVKNEGLYNLRFVKKNPSGNGTIIEQINGWPSLHCKEDPAQMKRIISYVKAYHKSRTGHTPITYVEFQADID